MRTELKIGIVGLGLIGASLAKAFKKYTSYEISGYDINPETITKAISDGTVDSEMITGECDLIISALYPSDTISFIESKADKIKKGAVVIDCGGTKRLVCEKCLQIAEKHGFSFVGAHPMAGTEHSGYDYSNAELFNGASLIICLNEKNEEIESVFGQIGFKVFKYTTPQEHDEVIAFTSQLAHVVSNAFVKSNAYPKHTGFSAGSLKDLTRVAWLNETMWTELFLENADNLANEIDNLTENLKLYSDAVRNHKKEMLCELLGEGRRIKEAVDKRKS